MKMCNYITKSLLLTIAMAALSGCMESSEDVESVFSTQSSDSNNGKQTYLVGSDANYPPLQFRDAKGQLTGLEIDMFSAVAKNQNFNAVFMPMKWGDIMPSLDSGSRDVGISLWYSEERAKKYDMTVPLYSTRFVLARLKKTGGADTVEDIRNAKIALQGPDTLNHTSYKNIGLGDESRGNELIMTDATYLAFKTMIDGKSDYVLDSDIQLRYFIKNSPFTNDDFVFIYDDEFPSATWVYAVKKGNTKLLNKINKGIENLRNSGEYQKIVDEWFTK